MGLPTTPPVRANTRAPTIAAQRAQDHEDTVEVIASLVDVLWYLRRVDEACALLTRQLSLQAEQDDVDAVVLAQGHAALGALQWEKKDLGAALLAFEKAEEHYLVATFDGIAYSWGRGADGRRPAARTCPEVGALAYSFAPQ